MHVSTFLDQSQEAMNGQVLRRTIRILNPAGFHLRPQSVFAQKALQFQSTVTLARDDKRVNGKSIFELMLLAAEQGTELHLEVCGDDAPAAMDALAEILSAPEFEEPTESSPPKKG